jgi:hypothetical protein
VITKMDKVGQIQGKDVFRITEAKVEKLGRDRGLSAQEVSKPNQKQNNRLTETLCFSRFVRLKMIVSM